VVSKGQLMKTSLLLSRVIMERVKISLHALQRHFADGPSDPPGQAGLLGRVLDLSHSVCFMLSNPTISPMNYKLTSSITSNHLSGSLDSLALGRKSFSSLAFLPNHPALPCPIYMERFCHDRTHVYGKAQRPTAALRLRLTLISLSE